MSLELRCAVAKAALIATLALGCSPAAKQSTSNFSGPVGLASAGANFEYVFVANTGVDAIQVIKVASALANTDLVPGPARYFPLYIPAGPNPTELAATVDGHYVLSLDLVTGSLRVIDANKLALVRDVGGQPLVVPVGPANGVPNSIVGASVQCPTSDATGTCLGRFYVTLRQGLVGVVDVRQDAAGMPSLNITEWIELPDAEPLRIATVPNQDVLFVSDASNPRVWRIDHRVSPAKIDSFNVGAVAGPLAVSGDGTMLVVGRPSLRDVVVFSNQGSSGLDGALDILDGNPIYTPAPMCLQACGTQDCSTAHPADSALCVEPRGMSTGENPYIATYLGYIPGQIAAITPPVGQMITGYCGINGSTPPQFAQGVAVATMEGSIFFVGLRDSTGAVNVQLVPQDSCAGASVTAGTNAAAPSSFLSACPDAPARARFSCLQDSTNTGVVRLARGQMPLPVTFSFAWEAALPGLDRPQGGGRINPDGTFTDPSLTPASAILDGDALQLTSAVPQVDPKCAAFSVGGCAEVRITDVAPLDPNNPSGQVVLTTQPQIPPECYANTPVLSYRIRAGHQFLVTATDSTGVVISPPERLPLGGVYGMGSAAGPQSVLMQSRALTMDPNSLGCALYTSQGDLLAGAQQDPLLNRRNTYQFTVTDPFVAARKGLQFDPTGVVTGTMGKVPGGMVVVAQGGTQALFVSFAGADLVFVTNPLVPASVQNDLTNNMILQ